MGYNADVVTYNQMGNQYTHLIIPGVGSFPHAMHQKNIRSIKKFRRFINKLQKNFISYDAPNTSFSF